MGLRMKLYILKSAFHSSMFSISNCQQYMWLEWLDSDNSTTMLITLCHVHTPVTFAVQLQIHSHKCISAIVLKMCVARMKYKPMSFLYS